MMKKVFTVLILVAVVVLALFLIKKRKEQLSNAPTPLQIVYSVKGTYPSQKTIYEETTFLGTVKAVNTVSLSAKKPAYIKKVFVDTSDKARKGQLLVLLDDSSITSQIESLTIEKEKLELEISSLKEKEKALEEEVKINSLDYERNKKLYEKKAVPKELLEKSFLKLKYSRANLKQVKNSIQKLSLNLNQINLKINELKNELKYFKIYSPVDGVVDRVYLREGNLAITGKPILSILSNSFEVVVNVPQGFNFERDTKVYLIHKGKEIPLRFITEFPSAEKNLKSLKFSLKDKPEDLPLNSFVKVRFKKEIKGEALPVNALLELTDKAVVLVYKDEKFVPVSVNVIGRNSDFIVVDEKLPNLPVAVADESKLRLLYFGAKGRIIVEEEK